MHPRTRELLIRVLAIEDLRDDVRRLVVDFLSGAGYNNDIDLALLETPLYRHIDAVMFFSRRCRSVDRLLDSHLTQLSRILDTYHAPSNP